MIDARQLEFSYRTEGFRLCVSDLSIPAGQRVALIGPSGSGKTTLLSLLAGILVPDLGAISINGAEISGLPDVARRRLRIRSIGLVFQEFELLEYLSVLDNILLPYRISSALTLNRAVRQRATQLAEQIGIADKLRRRPRELSQGERQRAALCRALLPRPSVILADEPTGNLDPTNRDKALSLIFDYVQSNDATFVAVTHERDSLDRFQQVIDITELIEGGEQ